MNTTKFEKEPIANFFIGPNKPCLAADQPHWVDREGIDKTFKEPNCKSKFKKSRQNYEYLDTGFRVNEH